jgi:hypothetical protein
LRSARARSSAARTSHDLSIVQADDGEHSVPALG